MVTMRSRRRFWWATSLAVGSFVLTGCAPSGTLPDLTELPGKISGHVGRPGVVIAAPHGGSDARTGEMVVEIGRRTGFGVVVATGFSLEPDTRAGSGRRYQVNRPLGRHLFRRRSMPRSTATTIATWPTRSRSRRW